MFCPNCGGCTFDHLFGGCCAYSCMTCNKSIYCRDIFTDEIEEDSKPVNFLRALKLRRRWKKKIATFKKARDNGVPV